MFRSRLLRLLLPWIVVACSGSDGNRSNPANTDGGARHPIPKQDNVGHCATTAQGYCGAKSGGTCWCDTECTSYGDCCSDYAPTCSEGGDCVATFKWLQKDA